MVSVVIIFLNAERFLGEAVESVLGQTYDAWELLLVDDGSADGSTALARHYAQERPGRVRYLEHPGHTNRGMSASRNLGVRHAAGDFVAFLDADDAWLPRKLEEQVALLQAHPEAAMVYGPTRWWYSWTGKPEDASRDFVHELGVPPNTLQQPPSLLTLFLQDERLSPCTCSMLVRREVVEQVGGFEESFQGMYEDQVFCAKICLQAPVLAMGECWYLYRQHPDSACSVALRTGEAGTARASFLTWLKAYLSDGGASDPELWQALERELRRCRRRTLERLTRHGRHVVQHARHHLLARTPGQLYGPVRHLALRSLSLPIVRHLRSLQFRRLDPLAGGRQRGTPIVRYYWDRFLRQHQHDIRGLALEIGTAATIRRYGGPALTRADALDLVAHTSEVTVVADLSRADQVPSETYDCFINQFTMHLIYDADAALFHAIRLLKRGGVLLVNFPCLDYYFPTGLDMGTGAPLFVYRWFTPIEVENLLRRIGLTDADYEFKVYGNLFARIAYQLNMPAEELTSRELDHVDPGHPLLVCARVVKPAGWQATRPEYRDPWLPAVTPARWNSVTGHYAR